ncbi:pantothenate transporter liz1 [Mycena olivaceomarginata]|nr:pantothenate transporter liz1 [Mycena olivaceomarginata]
MAAPLSFWTKERALIRKLDFGILIVACLGFFLKYLDQSNLANAYISGMKEDLNINGNEYTYTALMQVPSTMIVQKIRPSYYLAFCEIGWGVWTFAQAGAKNSQQMYVFRFMVGLFESAFFPVILYLLGSWYTKTELAKRAAIFELSGSVGSATAGYLQAAVYTNLDGHAGLAWLEVWYLSEEEKALALNRAIRNGKGQPTGKVDLALLKRTFSKWHWYWFVLGYVLYGQSCAATNYFGIWLKSENFSVSARNDIRAIQWGVLSDLTGSRFTWVFRSPGVWVDSKWEFAFLTDWVQVMTAIFYTWANEVCKGERALVVSSMNGFQFAATAWLPIVIFPQVEAPTFRKGFRGTFGLVIAALIVIGPLIFQFGK